MAKKDPEYLRRVKWMRCHICHDWPCDAHHITGAGMGMKAHDRDTIPLCRKHHSELHSLSGYFKGWSGAKLRNWQVEAVRQTRAYLEKARDIPF